MIVAPIVGGMVAALIYIVFGPFLHQERIVTNVKSNLEESTDE